MIDIPTLARSMVAQAQKYLVDQPGVFEVHFCDDGVAELGPTQLWRFIRDWELEDVCLPPGAHGQQLIGIVGDGAAVLYVIDKLCDEHYQEQLS